jgi:hypothetical protein
VCPFLPDLPVGYFYLPGFVARDKDANALRVCEWTHPQSDKYRGVLFANGEARSLPDRDFQAALKQPANEQFARQFLARDPNRQ